MYLRRSSEFWPRLLRRLRELGMSDHDIGAALGISHETVGYHIGSRNPRHLAVESRMFRARVMSRLLMPPYRWTQIQIGAVWGISNAKVCQDVREFRYENPRAA